MVEEQDHRNEDLDTLEQRLTPEVIERVDAKYRSPKERSQAVLDVLEQEDFTRWDYLCFAVEFIGQFSLAYFEHDRVVAGTAKLLGRWLYNIHYFFPVDVYGPPNEDGDRK